MRELRTERIIIKCSIRVDIDPINNDIILFCEDLPRNDIGVVIDFREEDSISLHEKSRLHERSSDEVKRIGGIVRENNLISATGEFLCDCFFGSIIEK
jgi:hypothetical protein